MSLFRQGWKAETCFGDDVTALHSPTNLLPQTSTDEFMENTKECAKITGNLDLWQEMFGDDDGRGQDSAFMDDNFGG